MLYDAGPDLSQVSTIEVRLSQRHGEILRYRAPKTVAQARFSLEFCVAQMLLHGHLDLSDLTEARLVDPALFALMARIQRIEADDADTELDGYAAWDQVSLVFPDGRRENSKRVTRPYGHFDNPAPATALNHKFNDCLRIAGRDGADLAKACTDLDIIEAQTLLDAMGNPARDLLAGMRHSAPEPS